MNLILAIMAVIGVFVIGAGIGFVTGCAATAELQKQQGGKKSDDE